MFKKENTFQETLETIRNIWVHRFQETPKAILDTIEANFSGDMKPIIVKAKKLESSWFFVISLPPHISYREFKGKENYFQDYCGGNVHIDKRGKAVYLEAMTGELKKEYKYNLWRPEKYENMYLPCPIGISPKGEKTIDLIDVPHVFVAGETNYGKSVLLHTITNALLLNREVFVIVIDLKIAEFAYLEDYALVINDIERTKMVLQLLNKEVDKRLRMLKQYKVRKVQKLLEKGGEMPFIILVIDELAEMQNEECQSALQRLAQLGRATGTHIIAATQRPSSTIFKKFGDLKAMFPCRVAFLTADAINSQMILDSDRASLLPAIKGRAIYKWGIEMLEVQGYLIDPDEEAPRLLAEKGIKHNVNTQVVKDLERIESPKMLPPR